jgi:hypothetical protein
MTQEHHEFDLSMHQQETAHDCCSTQKHKNHKEHEETTQVPLQSEQSFSDQEAEKQQKQSTQTGCCCGSNKK